ncbi:MAG: hypothetical protein ACRD2I_01385 [Vicinamibacterales bacterium]
MCYELLSYNEAFAGADTRQVERRVMAGKPVPLASLVPGIDPEIDEIIQRALKKDPNKRYQDAATFEKALERVRARLGPDEAVESPRPTPPPPPSMGGKSRAVRAEAAYQRALEAARTSSTAAARRFAVEALAEDPSHAAARAFLAGFEQRSVPTPSHTQAATSHTPGFQAGATSAGTAMNSTPGGADRTAAGGAGSTSAGGVSDRTAVGGAAGSTSVGGAGSTSVGGAESTAVGGASSTIVSGSGGPSAGRTAVGSPPGDATSTFASAPTMIVIPAAKGAAKPPPARNRLQALWGGGKEAPPTQGYARQRPPIKAHVPPPPPPPQAKRSNSAGRRQEPLWVQYRWPALGVGIALLVAVVAAGVYFVLGAGSGGQMLTITKPIGGTLSAAGIRCGSRGSDCSTSRPSGDLIEITPEADAGYTFSGYVGDCAPAGRTIMTMARTCGGTFVKEVVQTQPGATQTLTIAPVPTGGTLEGVDILCGTKGSICSANHPDGVAVELHPTADPDYTFMGFKGDCVPLGHTQMTGPRTCSATFSLTKDLAQAAPPVRPSPTPGPRGRSGGGAPSPSPTVVAVAPVTPPVTPVRPPGRGPVVDPTLATAKPVVPPQSDEDFAKGKIQEMLKAYCAAEEALDPDAVQKVYPGVNVNALRVQLNSSKYRSVQCKFGDVVFQSLDAAAGKAKVQAPLKRIYEHTILTEKPQVSELLATLTLVRLGQRTQWQIEDAKYAPLPK